MSRQFKEDLQRLLGQIEREVRGLLALHPGESNAILNHFNDFIDRLKQLPFSRSSTVPFHDEDPHTPSPLQHFSSQQDESMWSNESLNVYLTAPPETLLAEDYNYHQRDEFMEPNADLQNHTPFFLRASPTAEESYSVFTTSVTPDTPQSELEAQQEKNTINSAELAQLYSAGDIINDMISASSFALIQDVTPKQSKKRRVTVKRQSLPKRLNGQSPSADLQKAICEHQSSPFKTASRAEDEIQSHIFSNGSLSRDSDKLERIYGLLESRLRKRGIKQECAYDISFMADMILSIASPASFYQLYETLKTLEGPERSQIPKSCLTISQITKSLDALDLAAATNPLLRRLFLRRFLQDYNDRKEALLAKRIRTRALDPKGGEPGKIATLAINEMLKEAYETGSELPSDEDAHQRAADLNRKKFLNRMNCAKCWTMLGEEYSLAVVALIMTGNLFHMRDQRLEYLPEEKFQVFMEVLSEEKGELLREIGDSLSSGIEAVLNGESRQSPFKFEEIGPYLLSTQPSDSLTIFDWCQPA